MAGLLGKAFPLWTRTLPRPDTGPRGVKGTFQLSTQTSQTLIINLTDVGIDQINGVFIDNSANAQSFTLYNPITGQNIFVPANSQASLALITTKSTDAQTFIGSTTGLVDITVTFRNTEPQSDMIWSVLAPGSIAGSVTVQGQVTALSYAAAGSDATGVIAVASTSQTLFAANPTRKGFFISNPASPAGQGIATVESLFICIGAVATLGGAKMIEIAPGGYFQQTGVVDNRTINVIGATINHKFAATQYS